jgi:hypothetical protein
VAHAAPLFVAPARGAVCLLDAAELVSNCWPRATALRGDANVVALCAPRLAHRTIQVSGVMPDGVRQVTVLRRTFANTTVPVHNNVYVAILPAGNPLPLWVRYRRHGRTQRHPTGVSHDYRQKPCAANTGRQP